MGSSHQAQPLLVSKLFPQNDLFCLFRSCPCICPQVCQDGLLDLEDDIQKLTDRYIKLIDTIVKEKEDEILEV